MLGIPAGIAGGESLDADSAIDLQEAALLRIDQFDRTRPLPSHPTAFCIVIDPARSAKEIIDVHHDRESGQGLERTGNDRLCLGDGGARTIDDGSKAPEIPVHLIIPAGPAG